MKEEFSLVALCVECGRPVLPLSERCGPHHIKWVSKKHNQEREKRYRQSDKYKESLKRYYLRKKMEEKQNV